MTTSETPAAPRNTEEQMVGLAREFLKGVEFALSLVQSDDPCNVREVLAPHPESYRHGKRDAADAIARYLKPNVTNQTRSEAE